MSKVGLQSCFKKLRKVILKNVFQLTAPGPTWTQKHLLSFLLLYSIMNARPTVPVHVDAHSSTFTVIGLSAVTPTCSRHRVSEVETHEAAPRSSGCFLCVCV